MKFSQNGEIHVKTQLCPNHDVRGGCGRGPVAVMRRERHASTSGWQSGKLAAIGERAVAERPSVPQFVRETLPQSNGIEVKYETKQKSSCDGHRGRRDRVLLWVTRNREGAPKTLPGSRRCCFHREHKHRDSQATKSRADFLEG